MYFIHRKSAKCFLTVSWLLKKCYLLSARDIRCAMLYLKCLFISVSGEFSLLIATSSGDNNVRRLKRYKDFFLREKIELLDFYKLEVKNELSVKFLLKSDIIFYCECCFINLKQH